MANIPRKKKPGRFVDRVTLTALQVSQKKLTLDDTPTSGDSVVVNLPCGTVQILDTDYEVIGNEVSWDGKGLETLLEENDRIIITYS